MRVAVRGQHAGSQLAPVACPIALVPEDQVSESAFGLIDQDHAARDQYRTILDMALASDFCRWRQ